jgi:hypothetical protein
MKISAPLRDKRDVTPVQLSLILLWFLTSCGDSFRYPDDPNNSRHDRFISQNAESEARVSGASGILEFPQFCDEPGADRGNCLARLDRIETAGDASRTWSRSELPNAVEFTNIRPGMPLALALSVSGSPKCQSEWFLLGAYELSFRPFLDGSFPVGRAVAEPAPLNRPEIAHLIEPSNPFHCFVTVTASYHDRSLEPLIVEVHFVN